MCILLKVAVDYIFDWLNIFIAINFNEKEDESRSWLEQTKTDIPIFEVNKMDPFHFRKGKKIISNLVF
jgi:hypothetical protein